MNILKIIAHRLVFAALFMIVLSVPALAQAKGSRVLTVNQKVDGFIKKSGFDHSKLAEGVWTVDAPTCVLLIGTGQDVVVVFTNIAKKDKFKITAESMSGILRLADELDYLKFGIDERGDLFVRSEIKTKFINQAEFDDALARVVNGYDKASAKIAPFLIKE